MFGNNRDVFIKQLQDKVCNLECQIYSVNGSLKEELNFIIEKLKKMEECLKIRPVYKKMSLPFKVYKIDKIITCYEPIKKCPKCKKEL